MRLQLFQCDEFERRGVRCFKINRSCAVVIKRAFPARHTHAPFVARFQSGKTPLWMRRDKIVSIEHREVQKFLRDFYTDRMQANIFRPRSAKSIAIKSGHWIPAATFQLGSQDVSWHGAILTLEINFVKCWIVENARRKRSPFFRHEKDRDCLLAHSG